MVEQISDEELIERCRSSGGDSARVRYAEELFQRHYSRVALWCLRFCGNRDTASDLAQEVFLKVYQKLDSYRGSAKFTTWLYTVTRNHCFNALKAQAARASDVGDPLVLETLEEKRDNPYERVERRSSAALIRELMESALDETERKVMALHYGEDLPLDSVTRLLRLTNPSGAKAYIVSAKRKLNRAIERWKARSSRLTQRADSSSGG